MRGISERFGCSGVKGFELGLECALNKGAEHAMAYVPFEPLEPGPIDAVSLLLSDRNYLDTNASLGCFPHLDVWNGCNHVALSFGRESLIRCSLKGYASIRS